jgi:ABC-2 type transport system ATP-binding protein
MIRAHHLERAFDGRPVLRGVDLEVGPGERVALVGPNGSGKTTLLRALLGLVRAGGEISVAGHDPWVEHAAAQAHVAWVPQRAPALPLPVREVARAWSAMRQLPVERLGGVAAVFGLDLDALAGVRFPSLSGGMQQKLLAAMALASECPILLFDEPTANLDPHARDVFLGLLGARRPAPTVLLSSHRVEEVTSLVDRVLVLDDGRVRFDGGLDTFLADPTLARDAGLVAEVVPLRRSR